MNAKKLIGIIVLGALLLLQIGCSGDKAQMLQRLEQLEQQNRSGEAMLNDSLAESLVSYFDRHGDSNERMRSRYILGRTYYCLGELPRALEMYSEAADCADTTSADCDFAKLCRVYAQSAAIYYDQVQPRTQLENLSKAQWYAQKGKDTLMAIECFARQANAYKLMNEWDSVVYVTDTASKLFDKINRKDRSVQILYSELLALINLGNYDKAKKIIYLYEKSSGFFDKTHNIDERFGIYYYVKGLYYLGVHHVDSAEIMFRKVLVHATDFNNRIAGCKGLQAVYSQKGVVDSIAKYADLGYILNDSAYSLSEMQNIQKFQASYNYNHQKRLAEEKANDARNAYIAIAVIMVLLMFVAVIAWLWFRHHRTEQQLKESQYQQTLNQLEQAQSDLMELQEKNENASDLISNKSKKIEDLKAQIAQYQHDLSIKAYVNQEDQLCNAPIVKELNELLECNPVQSATQGQLRELRKLMNELLPSFYETLNHPQTLRPIEYEVCLLIRCHFKPAAISKLLDRDEAYVSNIRRRILHKVYGIEGNPKDLDERLMAII